MMNQEWKTKWIDALRSGRYPQGRERLGDMQSGMCCLGVLECIVRAELPELEGEYHPDRMYLSDEVRDVVGISHKSPKVLTPHGSLVHVTNLNDGNGTFDNLLEGEPLANHHENLLRSLTFPEIASILESNPDL